MYVCVFTKYISILRMAFIFSLLCVICPYDDDDDDDVHTGKAKKLQKPGLPPKGRVCQLTGKKRLNSTYLTFSHKRIKNVQYPNLQNKKIFWEEGQRWVKLRICTKAMKTLDKKGLDVMAREAGLNLWLLPHKKFDPQREEWKKQNPYPAKQLPTRFKKRKKWQLPNSMRGAKAFVSDEESRPMVGDVVNGRFVPRAAAVDTVVERKRNIVVNRRVAEDTVNPYEDMTTQFESLSTSSDSSEASSDAEVPPETPATEDAPESES